MKRLVLMFAAFGLLFACTPEENGAGDNNGNDGTVHVKGISLARPTATIKEGETVTLVATVTPDNADNKNVTWSTSSEAVATVDDNGKVTGVKAGSATITATTEDGGKKATCALSVEANLAPSVTVEANHVSAISAVLAGKANLGSSAASDLKVGFQYSKSAGILPSNSTTIEATDADASYNYTAAITGLDPETKYYFRSFVRQNGQDTYGETKEFSTKEAASLLETKEASGVEATKATLNAKLDMTDVLYKSLAYGFLWGTSESALNTDFKCTEIKDNAIAASLTSLSHKTQYWYKAYVKLDIQTFYGVVKTFTTDIVPVESVSLDKSEYTFSTIGNTLTLKATVLPSDATDKNVEWSSDKEDVATVDQNGKVTAKANGKAIITVTTKDQGKTASCEVTVAQGVTGITLDKSSVTLNEGESYTLIPTVNPDNAAEKKLAWTSSDESIATVDQTGKVTAVSKGSATIKATATDGSEKYASCSVTVKRLVSSIQLNKASLVMYNGTSETLTATVTPSSANNTSVTWTSSNTTVATVSSSGVVTGKSRGNATITVTANDGSGVSATCQVEVKQYVTTITLSQTSLSLVIGEEETISVTSVLPDNANDKTYTWSSSDNMIATVDNSGKVTAVSNGTATIKAEANDGSGVFASCSVTVERPVSSIQLNKTSLVLYRGTSNVSETLTATVVPSDANNTAVTWTSSNTSVVTVSSSGVVTGKSKGTATITVTANDGNGAQATCAVEVKQYVTSISLDKTSITLVVGTEATLSVTSVLPDNANDKTYIWSSSDSAIASVDNSDKVTARASGTATIRATANDGSGVFASCSVVVFAEKVDMGIKTSDGKTLYWSTRNLCESGFVNSPEEYGDYYAWGETAPYYSSQNPLTWKTGKSTGYEWASYKWCNGSSDTLTKYNTQSSYGTTVDYKTVLDLEDDVAHVKLGGNWRMPTDAEWTELRNNCTWTWVTNYNGTGINGRLVTSNTNGNSIFLPAAGRRDATKRHNAGSFGYYWSSSLNTLIPRYALSVSFYSDNVRKYGCNRNYGLSVRPVSE